ncbi:NXPE family member 3-like [Diadema antillarum]|uniref:NXPE family member 3-like n=1 Tax=Diadema antillarum TaxID=105358 RepID=UPI003A8B5CA3
MDYYHKLLTFLVSGALVLTTLSTWQLESWRDGGSIQPRVVIVTGADSSSEVHDTPTNGEACTQPREKRDQVQHPLCPHRQVRFFPRTDRTFSISQPGQDEINSSRITSGKYSWFEIIHRRPFHVCDEIEIRIHARSANNEPKEYGGDYFRIKVYTVNATFNASTTPDGEVWDHRNGTYSAYVTLKWEGLTRINVTLVHPSEAVYLLETYRHTRPTRFNFNGLFVSGNVSEDVSCNFMPWSNKESYCNFVDKASGIPWYCEKPSKKRLRCSDWRFHRRYLNVMKEGELNPLRASEKMAFDRIDEPVHGPVRQVQVSRQVQGSIQHAIERLPGCDPRSDLKPYRLAGFYINNVWYSPYCKLRKFSGQESMLNCLANRHWYYYGDSTIRQLFSYVTDVLPLPRTRRNDNYDTCSRINATNEEWSIQMYYEFHYLPIHHTTWLDMDLIRVEPAYFKAIRSDIDVVIVVSIWAHYTHLPLWLFRERIHAVLDAADELYSRNSRSVVILKSANTRNHEDRVRSIVSSDWSALRLFEIAREMAAAHPHVGFLNAWDISSAQFAKDEIHPLPPHARNLNRMFLSMLCSQ